MIIMSMEKIAVALIQICQSSKILHTSVLADRGTTTHQVNNHLHKLDFTGFRAINGLNSLYVWLCKPQKGYLPLHNTPEVKPIPNKQYFKKIQDDSKHLFC